MNDDQKISDVNSSQTPVPNPALDQPVAAPVVSPVGSLNKEAAPIVSEAMTSEMPTILTSEVEQAGVKEVKDYQPVEHITISEKPTLNQPAAPVKTNKFTLPETFFEVKQMLKINKKVTDASRWFATLAEKIFKMNLQKKPV